MANSSLERDKSVIKSTLYNTPDFSNLLRSQIEYMTAHSGAKSKVLTKGLNDIIRGKFLSTNYFDLAINVVDELIASGVSAEKKAKRKEAASKADIKALKSELKSGGHPGSNREISVGDGAFTIKKALNGSNKNFPLRENGVHTDALFVIKPNPNDYDYRQFIRSNMLYEGDKDLWANRINRWKFVNPYYILRGTPREYLFFTKPSLHITMAEDLVSNMGATKKRHTLNPELARYPFWTEFISKHWRSLIQLQRAAAPSLNPFMTMLTNAVITDLDMPSISSEEMTTGANIYGTSLSYRGSSYKSDEGYDFSLSFYDNPQLEVYYLFKAYDEYERLKKLGLVTPPGQVDCNPYRILRVIHDQFAIFKFIVDSDGETILYYAKLTGVYPKNCPRDTFDKMEAGRIEHSIDFHANIVEDMNPSILEEFNRISRGYIGADVTNVNPTDVVDDALYPGGPIVKKSSKYDFAYIPPYNLHRKSVNGLWVSAPVVFQENIDTGFGTRINNSKYKLCWFQQKIDTN